MQSKSITRPHMILPVLAMIGIILFSCLIYAKFYGNGAASSAFSAVRIPFDSARNHMAILAAAIPSVLWSAGLLLPSFSRFAGATPLRGLAVVAAAMLAFCAMTLPGLAGRLPAEAVPGFFYDAAVLLVVCLLLVFEGLLLLATRPGRGNAEPVSAVGRMRAALFLFMLAEELSRSFLPLYARELYTPVPGLSETVMMGLPIGLFMALVAVFTPFAGHWADRFGSRRTLLLGTLPAVAGFIGTAMAGSMVELLLWRGACALGYAVMFIGAQGFVARHTPADRRARGMAQFVAAVIVAGLCGAPLGGILADQFGYRTTFVVSALLALAAAAAVTLLPVDRLERMQRRPFRIGDAVSLLSNPRFVALLLFSSVPTKLMLTGYLFYLVPVSLHAAGETPAGIGRLMMTYGLIIVLLGPWVSGIADRTGRHALFAGFGGLIGGAGTLAILQEQGVAGILIGIAALGVAHAFNNATQLALVPEVCRADCVSMGDSTVFGVYRLLERGGSVIGPLLAAALADRFGIQAALVALGVLGMLCGTAFCVVFLLVPSASPAAGEAAR